MIFGDGYGRVVLEVVGVGGELARMGERGRGMMPAHLIHSPLHTVGTVDTLLYELTTIDEDSWPDVALLTRFILIRSHFRRCPHSIAGIFLSYIGCFDSGVLEGGMLLQRLGLSFRLSVGEIVVLVGKSS